MANAPQGSGGGQAEGGHVFNLNAAVPSIDLGNGPLDNRVQNIDIRTVAPDSPTDRDYDDPYPGGPTKTLGVPGDG